MLHWTYVFSEPIGPYLEEAYPSFYKFSGEPKSWPIAEAFPYGRGKDSSADFLCTATPTP